MISFLTYKMGDRFSHKQHHMTMLSRLFYAHGHFCASHPWEVLFTTVTVTISLMSMSLWATNSKVCGWNYFCMDQEELKSSDVIVLSLTRCLAIIYIYLQFRNLRKLGSKYLLGLAGVFTIFSSFIFSIAIANLIGFNLDGLNEALPFFLLLVDLSKASALARLTLTALSQDELQKNIGQGMAVIGPALTLDVMVETLAIGVGTISGVRQLETMCCFGCLSVIANYLAFMTFYPACLSLVLELSRDRNQGKPLQQLRQLAKVMQKEEDEKIPPNPVAQRIKMIMSAGLVLVHAHSRLVAPDTLPLTPGVTDMALEATEDHRVQPEMPLWQFYVARFLTAKVDYGLTLVLAVALTLKYILMDNKVDQEVQDMLASQGEPSCSLGNSNINHSGDQHGSHGDGSNEGLRRRILSTSDSKQQGSERKGSVGILKSSVPSNAASVVHRATSSGNDESFKPATFFMEEDSSSSGDENGSNKDVSKLSIGTQTEVEQVEPQSSTQTLVPSYQPNDGDLQPRPLEECVSIMNSDAGPSSLTDPEVASLVASRHIPSYKLESMLGDHVRGVAIRRQILTKKLKVSKALDALPFQHYDYKYVEGACCENVIGYMPVPVGVAGPLMLDGEAYHVPMATTEGCLVASTNRGCRALEQSGGVTSCITNDGMTRGPVVRFPSAFRASEMKKWMEVQDNYDLIKESFDSTSRFARLKKLHIGQAGRSLYIRFVSVTGDAMGMNMLSKGSEKALAMLSESFPDMEVISLSGNFCTDKKPAAINWIEGRGKSVVCEAIIKASVVKSLLKTSVAALVDLNISKNLVGSAMAGSIGGFNAHASNIVTAIYIAAGQDPAQNVASSNCLMLMEAWGPEGEDLHVSATMPSIEVGTVGGGTVLPPQSACLEMLGVKGSHQECPGSNAQRLARVICATVLAGELSLMSALAAGHLVKSHLKHNRSTLQMKPESRKSSIASTESPSTSHVASEPLPPACPDPVPGTCTAQAS